MLFTVDIGNTNIMFGIFKERDLINHWRIGTDKNKTFDEYGVLFRNLLDIRGVDVNSIRGAVISCVVPTLLDVIVRALKSYFDVNPLVVEPGIKTGMPILYHNPKDVGADRIVNAVAAFDEYKSSVIVVDFGTATTFDCVSEKGEYIGGTIATGILISAEALFGSASRLPRVEIVRPKTVIGKNTVHCMQSGLVFGYAGLVDGIVSRIKDEMGTSPKVIATGGLASVIASESKSLQYIDEFLSLKGLRLVYEWNT
ncbi:MAG TPA: type III pantothenate kinase [Thermodesulfobacteriota bacterium]|jgi:type III pantothenate kinase